jgi:hypothetical protein
LEVKECFLNMMKGTYDKHTAESLLKRSHWVSAMLNTEFQTRTSQSPLLLDTAVLVLARTRRQKNTSNTQRLERTKWKWMKCLSTQKIQRICKNPTFANLQVIGI